MDIPHTFPTLLNPDEGLQPILLIGSGMSYGIVPQVLELSKEIKNNHKEIIKKLGVDPSPPPEDQFYDWADKAFNLLKTELGLSDNEAKKRLAAAMGITTDLRFHARVGMPLRGNTPRHRVVARFAREGRWKAIWSLNWDCVLETALESVGLLNHPNPGKPIANPLPWQRWYCPWSPRDLHSPASRTGTLNIIKPHGCVKKLAKGDSLFVVTRSELGILADELKVVPGRMVVELSDSPLTVAGWAGGEDYIHENIDIVSEQGTLPTTLDRLSIIDPSWNPTPPSSENKNHNRLASAFQTDQAHCHFATSPKGHPSTDDFFQWLQTRFGLGRIRVYANAQDSSWSSQIVELDKINANFSEPNPGHWLNHLFDDFLSVWIRLCFNLGRVIYKNNSASVPQNLISTHRRDEHIPWGCGHSERYDMLAVIPLILAIWKSSDTKEYQWDFAEFPGALWNSWSGHLILPLPAWGKIDQPLELAALKPLMECWNWSHKGAIKQFSILPLHPEPSGQSMVDAKFVFRSSVAWLMKANKYANPENISVLSLSDIRGRI